MYISLQGFQETRELVDEKICLWMRDATKVAAVAVGEITLQFSGDRVLVLVDCLYVPLVRRNLISVPSLACNGYSVCFNKNNVLIKKDDETICIATLIDNLYILNPISPIQHINSNESNLKRKVPSNVNQTKHWHLGLGHTYLNRIHKLVTSGHLSSLDVTCSL